MAVLGGTWGAQTHGKMADSHLLADVHSRASTGEPCLYFGWGHRTEYVQVTCALDSDLSPVGVAVRAMGTGVGFWIQIPVCSLSSHICLLESPARSSLIKWFLRSLPTPFRSWFAKFGLGDLVWHCKLGPSVSMWKSDGKNKLELKGPELGLECMLLFISLHSFTRGTGWPLNPEAPREPWLETPQLQSDGTWLFRWELFALVATYTPLAFNENTQGRKPISPKKPTHLVLYPTCVCLAAICNSSDWCWFSVTH